LLLLLTVTAGPKGPPPYRQRRKPIASEKSHNAEQVPVINT
jgi:hypothetical protein